MRRLIWLNGVWLVGIMIAPLGACDWGTDNPTAPDSLTLVFGGKGIVGSVDAPPTEIDATAMPTSNNNSVFPGVSNKQVSGIVGPLARAVAIGVPGDSVYWLVPAPTKDAVNSDLQLFSARYSMSLELAKSALIRADTEGKPSLPLFFRAVDEQGRFGAATILSLEVITQAPAAALTIKLEWDAPVDLDLHVLVPASNGVDVVEVWSKLPTGVKKGRDLAGLTLDMDSNAGCLIDNHNKEMISFAGIPNAGHYLVRVEPYALCGQYSVAWRATAYREDRGTEPFKEASGILTDAATRTKLGEGAGITAFEFDYP